jgi:putative hydroxymethylpyrimidine transport system substrate-binding protein
MKKRFLRTALSAAVLASSGLVVASMTTVGAASGASTTKVNFVYDFPGPDMELIPIVVGQDQGFYKAAGLDVNTLFPASTSSTSAMLATGAGDIGFITTSDMADAIQAKVPLLSVANYSMSNNWTIFAKPGSSLTASDLKGKRIFSWGDTWTNTMLGFVLKHFGLTSKQITVVTASDDTPLLMDGKIDFDTSTTNYAVPAIEGADNGKQPVMFTGSQIGVPNIPIWNYAVTQSYAAKNPATIKAFLSATLAATKWAITNPKQAVADFVKMYPKSGYTPAYSTTGWALTIPLLTNSAGKFFVETSAQWATLDQGLIATGQIKTAPAPTSYFTNKFDPAQ